jgi:hypothetical protein
MHLNIVYNNKAIIEKRTTSTTAFVSLSLCHISKRSKSCPVQGEPGHDVMIF